MPGVWGGCQGYGEGARSVGRVPGVWGGCHVPSLLTDPYTSPPHHVPSPSTCPPAYLAGDHLACIRPSPFFAMAVNLIACPGQTRSSAVAGRQAGGARKTELVAGALGFS